MKSQIVYEDHDILVVAKPAGLVVNRAETIREETLQDQLADYFHLGQDLGIGGRAGIVHRLDRETSGLLIIAKTTNAFGNLQAQFKDRLVKKEYIALVHQHVKEKTGSIDLSISRIGKFGKFGVVGANVFHLQGGTVGRSAQTDFAVGVYYQLASDKFESILGQFKKTATLTKSRIRYLEKHARQYTLLSRFPKTGRTHQVRVHLKSLGHPVVSDLIYTPHKLLKFDLLWCTRLFLHAKSLEIKHPTTGKSLKLTSNLPKDLKHAISNLTIDN